MIINDLDGYYIVFDTKNWNTELDTLIFEYLSHALFGDLLIVWRFFLLIVEFVAYTEEHTMVNGA